MKEYAMSDTDLRIQSMRSEVLEKEKEWSRLKESPLMTMKRLQPYFLSGEEYKIRKFRLASIKIDKSILNNKSISLNKKNLIALEYKEIATHYLRSGFSELLAFEILDYILSYDAKILDRDEYYCSKNFLRTDRFSGLDYKYFSIYNQSLCNVIIQLAKEHEINHAVVFKEDLTILAIDFSKHAISVKKDFMDTLNSIIANNKKDISGFSPKDTKKWPIFFMLAALGYVNCFKWMMIHSENPIFSIERYIDKIVRVAIRYNQVDMVRYILDELKTVKMVSSLPDRYSFEALKQPNSGLFEYFFEKENSDTGFEKDVYPYFLMITVKLERLNKASLIQNESVSSQLMKNEISRIIKYLINQGLDINASDPLCKKSLLCFAAEHGLNDLVKDLVQMGSNVNQEDESGFTPIMYALKNGHREIIDTLLLFSAEMTEQQIYILKNDRIKIEKSARKSIDSVKASLKPSFLRPYHDPMKKNLLISEEPKKSIEKTSENFYFYDPEALLKTLKLKVTQIDQKIQSLLASPVDTFMLIALELLSEGDNQGGIVFVSAALNIDTECFDSVEYIELIKPSLRQIKSLRSLLPLTVLISDELIESCDEDQWAQFYKSQAVNFQKAGNHFKAFRMIEEALKYDETILDNGSFMFSAPLNIYFMEVENKDIDEFCSVHFLQNFSDMAIFYHDRAASLLLVSNQQSECYQEYKEILDKAHNPDLNIQSHQIYIILSFLGYRRTIQKLIQCEFGKEFVNTPSNIKSLLSFAAYFGQIDIIRYLTRQLNAKIDEPYEFYQGDMGLLIATWAGLEKDVKNSLSRNALPNLCDARGRTPLILAVCHGKIESVKQLLRSGADINICDHKGDTALTIAVELKNHDLVKILLRYSPDLNRIGRNGKTPLMTAACEGQVELVRAFISAGAAIDAVDKAGCTALMLASQTSHTKVVELLLIEGSDINYRSLEDITALMIAAAYNQEEMLQLLLDYGAKVSEQNRDGFSALMRASMNRHFSMVRHLLESGAEVNQVQKAGYNALMYAASQDTTKGIEEEDEIIRLLISQGAELAKEQEKALAENSLLKINSEKRKIASHRQAILDSVHERFREIVKSPIEKGLCDDMIGGKCLSVIIESLESTSAQKLPEIIEETLLNSMQLLKASHDRNVDLVRALLKKCVYINYEDRKGWTPLNAAAYHEYLEIVNLLLSHQAMIDYANINGDTALFRAIRRPSLVMVRRLLQSGAQVNYQKLMDMSALMIVADIDQDSRAEGLLIAQTLIEWGCRCDLRTSWGMTALMYASEGGYTELVKILLANQPNINAVNLRGYTALTLAVSKGQREIVRQLMTHGATFIHSDHRILSKEQVRLVKEEAEITGCLPHLFFEQERPEVKKVNRQPQLFRKENRESNQIGQIQPLSSSPMSVALLPVSSENLSSPIVEEKTERQPQVLLDDLKSTQIKSDENIHDVSLDGRTRLMQAAVEGKFDEVDHLLKMGAKLSLKDNQGQTALMIASYHDQLEIVRRLLQEKNLYIDLQDKNGYSALMLAVMQNNEEIIECLIAKKANKNLTDSQGCTALMIASEYLDEEAYYPKYLTKSKEFIIDHQLNRLVDGNINAKNKLEKTALMISIENRKPCVANWILNKKADVTTLDKEKKSALMYACKYGLNMHINKLIYKSGLYGSNINAVDHKGRTALMIACRFGNKEMITAMVKLRCDIHIKDYRNHNALMYALSHDSAEIRSGMARYLIENKASVNGSQRDTMDDRAKSVFEDIMGSIGFGYGK